ncbi:MAG: hypothetical protein ACRDIU_03550, partial [Actinomycetota bacterium]
GDSLQEAFDLLVSGQGAPKPGTTPGAGEEEPDDQPIEAAESLREALEHYTKAEAALREGDFATYGAEQKLLKEALDKASQQAGAASPASSPSPSPTGR